MGTKRTYAIIDHGDVQYCVSCGRRASVIQITQRGAIGDSFAAFCLVDVGLGRKFNKRVNKAKANAKYDGVNR